MRMNILCTFYASISWVCNILRTQIFMLVRVSSKNQ